MSSDSIKRSLRCVEDDALTICAELCRSAPPAARLPSCCPPRRRTKQVASCKATGSASFLSGSLSEGRCAALPSQSNTGQGGGVRRRGALSPPSARSNRRTAKRPRRENQRRRGERSALCGSISSPGGRADTSPGRHIQGPAACPCSHTAP